MAAERPPAVPYEHAWNLNAGAHQRLDVSDELRQKLGGEPTGIRNTKSGLSMVPSRSDLPSSMTTPHDRWREPNPSIDPKRYTVEVHGSPNGVTFRGQELSAKELAEVIKGAPGYKPGAPVRLLSCNTGADLPDGSPNFAQQLSKELGVEVLAPKTNAWVDNFGNMYASESRAKLDPNGPDGVQATFDEPGQWASFHPDGTQAVHDSPYPPGHEPEWVRHGAQAANAEQRGLFDRIFGRNKQPEPSPMEEWAAEHVRSNTFSPPPQQGFPPQQPGQPAHLPQEWRQPQGQAQFPQGQQAPVGPQPGQPQQGQYQQGVPQQGQFQQSPPQQQGQFAPQQGQFQQGPLQPGPAQQGVPQQGPYQQGPVQQGQFQQGAPQPGQYQQSAPQQGQYQQGPALQGQYQQGAPQPGQPQQGAPQPGQYQQRPPQSGPFQQGAPQPGQPQHPAVYHQPGASPQQGPGFQQRPQDGDFQQGSGVQGNPQRGGFQGDPQNGGFQQRPQGAPPQHPVQPAVRPAAPAPAEVSGPQQTPSRPRSDGPSARSNSVSPVDVSGPRQGGVPRQSVPPVDVSGPRLDGPSARSNSVSPADVSGPPQNRGGQSPSVDAGQRNLAGTASPSPTPEPHQPVRSREDFMRNNGFDRDSLGLDDASPGQHDGPDSRERNPLDEFDFFGNKDFRATEEDLAAMRESRKMLSERELQEIRSRADVAHITDEELSAMHLYTGPEHANWNEALRSGDPDAVREYETLIRNAVSGMNKLPDWSSSPSVPRLLRGIQIDSFSAMNMDDFLKRYEVGNSLTENGFTSSTKDDLADPSNDGKPAMTGNVEFVIDAQGAGKDIAFLKPTGGMREVVFPPGGRFEVTHREFDEENNKWKIYLSAMGR